MLRLSDKLTLKQAKHSFSLTLQQEVNSNLSLTNTNIWRQNLYFIESSKKCIKLLIIIENLYGVETC